MRQAGVPYAIATYPIPPHPPAPVQEAKDEFDTIATRWANTKGKLDDAKEALEAAKAADLRAVVEAATDGKDVKNPQVNAYAAEALIADLRVQVRGLDVAVDEAGNRLAEAIATHRDEWLPLLADAEDDATARFDRAIAEAQAALTDLRPARGAVTWLNGFDVALAPTGRQTPFAGGRLRVKSTGTLRGTYDPSLLLEAAAKVTTDTTPELVYEKVTTHA